MVAGRDLGRGAPAGLSGGGHGFAPEAATDHSLVLGAERKLQAEGLRRVKAYRVERRTRDLVGRLRPPREGVDGGLRWRAPAGLAAAEDHGGLAGRRLRCPHSDGTNARKSHRRPLDQAGTRAG